jgi:uncharacterized membrane protein YesL
VKKRNFLRGMNIAVFFVIAMIIMYFSCTTKYWDREGVSSGMAFFWTVLSLAYAVAIGYSFENMLFGHSNA